MFRRKDVLLIAAILLLALVLYGVTALSRNRQEVSGMVEIRVGGDLYETVPLSEDREIHIEQPGGEDNLVMIENGAVRMGYSSCANQLCVQQSEVTADNWARRSLGRSIICLPNQVLVELALSEDHPSMQDPTAPDI